MKSARHPMERERKRRRNKEKKKLCRGFPQCTDVSKVKGNSGVRGNVAKSVKTPKIKGEKSGCVGVWSGL